MISMCEYHKVSSCFVAFLKDYHRNVYEPSLQCARVYKIFEMEIHIKLPTKISNEYPKGFVIYPKPNSIGTGLKACRSALTSATSIGMYGKVNTNSKRKISPSNSVQVCSYKKLWSLFIRFIYWLSGSDHIDAMQRCWSSCLATIK